MQYGPRKSRQSFRYLSNRSHQGINQLCIDGTLQLGIHVPGHVFLDEQGVSTLRYALHTLFMYIQRIPSHHDTLLANIRDRFARDCPENQDEKGRLANNIAMEINEPHEVSFQLVKSLGSILQVLVSQDSSQLKVNCNVLRYHNAPHG